jgi:hypothetical protein
MSFQLGSPPKTPTSTSKPSPHTTTTATAAAAAAAAAPSHANAAQSSPRAGPDATSPPLQRFIDQQAQQASYYLGTASNDQVC